MVHVYSGVWIGRTRGFPWFFGKNIVGIFLCGKEWRSVGYSGQKHSSVGSLNLRQCWFASSIARESTGVMFRRAFGRNSCWRGFTIPTSFRSSGTSRLLRRKVGDITGYGRGIRHVRLPGGLSWTTPGTPAIHFLLPFIGSAFLKSLFVSQEIIFLPGKYWFIKLYSSIFYLIPGRKSEPTVVWSVNKFYTNINFN